MCSSITERLLNLKYSSMLLKYSIWVNLLSLFCSVLKEVERHVPDWVCQSLTQARLPGDILNVLLLHNSRRLSLTVGHSEMPCASLTSRPLRQVMFGLLLGGGKSILAEPERDGLQIKFTRIPPTFKGVIRQLALDSLDKVKPLGCYPI